MFRRIGLVLVVMVLMGSLHLKAAAAPPRFPAFKRFQTARVRSAIIEEYLGDSFRIFGYGELIVPNQVHLARFLPDYSEELEEFYVDGTTLYQIDELAGVWDAVRNVPGVNGTEAFEPAITPDLVAAITVITRLPDEVVAGVVTNHYRADVDSAILLAWPNAPTAAARARAVGLGVNVDVWLGADDGIVRQQQTLIEAKDFTTKPVEVERQIQVVTYENINEPLTITFPAIEVPPTPEVPPEGVPIYPPKYPRAGRGVRATAEQMLKQRHQRHAPLRTAPAQTRPGTLN